jgi:hypothetical protein
VTSLQNCFFPKKVNLAAANRTAFVFNRFLPKTKPRLMTLKIIDSIN